MSNFPGSIDSFPMPQGTTQLSDPTYDHALLERNHGSSIIAVQTFLGSSGGTNVFNGYTAGQFPLPINSGTLGTIIAKGTINNSVFGTPSATGGTYNNGVFGTGQYNGGSATFTNGTLGVGTIGTANINVGTIGTLSGGSLTTGNFQTGQFLRLLDNTQNYQIMFGTIAGTFSAGSVLTGTANFSGTFATKAIFGLAGVNTTQTLPVSQLNAQAFSVGTKSMNIEVRSFGGTSNDAVTIGYIVIGY